MQIVESINPLTGMPIADGDLKSLSELVGRQLAIESDMAIIEKTLELRKEDLKKLQFELIPNKMQELGLDSLILSNGTKVIVEDHFSAGIPTQESCKKDIKNVTKRHDCFMWLKRHGGENIISSEIICSYTKGQAEEIGRVVKILEKSKVPFNLLDSVHWQTLRSFLKEQIQSGQDVPRDLFSVYEGKRAKLTL